jgi:hypothetical protein
MSCKHLLEPPVRQNLDHHPILLLRQPRTCLKLGILVVVLPSTLVAAADMKLHPDPSTSSLQDEPPQMEFDENYEQFNGM